MNELADIQSCRCFRAALSGRSYEGKLFAGSFGDAVQFGRLMQAGLASAREALRDRVR